MKPHENKKNLLMRIIYLVTIVIVVCCFQLNAQGLVLNEMSNGTSGSREFMEFVVEGAPCTNIDLRGWIIDDNNGDFSCGPCANTGIATGHLRLANIAQWSSVPTGTIIVIYNELDVDPVMPASDPTDANADGVFIVPSNHTSLEYSTTPCANPNIPTALNNCPGPCTGNGGYSGVCYTSGGNGWATLGLRNTGDAGQSRTPAGAYYHGFAYGTPANNMSGGLDGLIDPVAGTNLSFFFDNSISNDYRDVNNWSSIAAASATPGASNNINNLSWINSFDCPLPVQLSSFNVECTNRTTWEAHWTTQTEINNEYFILSGSNNGIEYTEITRVNGMGNLNELHHYQTAFYNFQGYRYFRLTQKDYNGTVSLLAIMAAECSETTEMVNCSFVNGNLIIQLYDEFSGATEVKVQTTQGSIIHKKQYYELETISIPLHEISSGIYFFSVYSNQTSKEYHGSIFIP